MTIIKDWSLQVQWDDSKIKKGIKSLDKTMSKIYSPRVVNTQRKMNGLLERQVKMKSQGYKNEIKATRQRNKEWSEAIKEDRKFNSAKAREAKQSYANDVSQAKFIQAGKLKAEQELSNARKRAYNDSYAQAKFINDGLVRNENARIKALRQIEDLQYRINRQAASAATSHGGEAVKAGITSRQEKLSSMQGMLLSGGMSTAAIEDLQHQLRGLSRETLTANTEINRLSRSMTLQQSVSRGLKDSIHNLARSYLSIFAIGAGGVGMYKVGEQLQQIQASLVGVAGSQEGVGKEWDYISSRAKGLGQDLNVMAKGYQQIAMAGKAMGMSEETYKNIFMAASEASAAFNLSVDDAEGVQRAFVQMASKGKISSEEIRQQLG